MGKYTKKGKITGDVAIMEVSQSSSLGVRTRARTLALQRLNTSTPSPQSHQFQEPAYLELRTRRLEKIPLLNDPKKYQQQPPKDADCKQNPNPSTRTSSRLRSVNSGSVGSVSLNFPAAKESDFGKSSKLCGEGDEVEEYSGVEASFGENCLEFEARERNTRESTPCSLIGDPETFGTPGSTTRRTCSTTMQRVQISMQQNIPTTNEMEEFFVYAEQQQQRLFAEKYNFDIMNELPLPGRYEWVCINP